MHPRRYYRGGDSENFTGIDYRHPVGCNGNNLKNDGGWPMERLIAVSKLTTPIAIPVVPVGRMIEPGGSLRLRKWERLRHDQVSLEILATKRWRIKVGRSHRYSCDRIHCCQGRGVARLIRPGLKVHCLGGADTDQDSEHLHTGLGGLRDVQWIPLGVGPFFYYFPWLLVSVVYRSLHVAGQSSDAAGTSAAQ